MCESFTNQNGSDVLVVDPGYGRGVPVYAFDAPLDPDGASVQQLLKAERGTLRQTPLTLAPSELASLGRVKAHEANFLTSEHQCVAVLNAEETLWFVAA